MSTAKVKPTLDVAANSFSTRASTVKMSSERNESTALVTW